MTTDSDQSFSPFEELGDSGLDVSLGTIHEERLKQLVSHTRRFLTYREMESNDPVIGAELFALDLLLRQVDWTVEAGKIEDERTEFIDSAFMDMDQPFKETISDILSMLVHGFSWHEIVFKQRKGHKEPGDEEASSLFEDGKVGWAKWASRSQTTLHKWEFDKHGEVMGMWQQAPPTYKQVFIPKAKSLHFRTTTRGQNPEGKSVLRNAYRPWYFKKTIEEIQAIGIERDLAGLPTMGVPANLMRGNRTAAENTERASYEKTLRQIRRGTREGVLYPLEYDSHGNQKVKFELLTSGGRRQFDTQKLLEYYDQRIAMTTLADVILLGHEGVGSFALADSKTSLFGMAASTFLDLIQDVINRTAIPQLLRLNGMDTDDHPILVHSNMETIDLPELGEYVSKLAGSGVDLFPDTKLENYLRSQGGLPPVSEEVLTERETREPIVPPGFDDDEDEEPPRLHHAGDEAATETDV